MRNSLYHRKCINIVQQQRNYVPSFYHRKCICAILFGVSLLQKKSHACNSVPRGLSLPQKIRGVHSYIFTSEDHMCAILFLSVYHTHKSQPAMPQICSYLYHRKCMCHNSVHILTTDKITRVQFQVVPIFLTENDIGAIMFLSLPQKMPHQHCPKIERHCGRGGGGGGGGGVKQAVPNLFNGKGIIFDMKCICCVQFDLIKLCFKPKGITNPHGLQKAMPKKQTKRNYISL